MTQQTKNPLTRDRCKEKLYRAGRADLLQDAVLLALLLLLFVPLLFGSLRVAKGILPLGILLALLCTVPPTVFAIRIFRDATRLARIRRDGFSIVTDTVMRLSKEIPKTYSEGRREDVVVYFAEHGRCSSLQTPIDLVSVGDTFYLVVLHEKKPRIALAYPTMLYELQEK